MLVFVAPGREMPSYQKEKRCIVKSSPALKLLMNMCSNKLHSLFIENICSNKLHKLFMDVSNDQTCLVLDLPWEQKYFLGDYSLLLLESVSFFFFYSSISFFSRFANSKKLSGANILWFFRLRPLSGKERSLLYSIYKIAPLSKMHPLAPLPLYCTCTFALHC